MNPFNQMNPFAPAGQIQYFLSNRSKKVTLGPLFRSKNDENRACVTKLYSKLRLILRCYGILE